MVKSVQKGFTLIEILIALAIFAVIGVAAATCLHEMITYRARITQQSDQWKAMAVARLLMQKDFSNAVDLDQKDFNVHMFPKFNGSASQLVLTRWNLMQATWSKNSAIFVGVTYQLIAGNLMRITANDKGHTTASIILPNVSKMQLQYLSPLRQWKAQWASGNQLNGLSLITSLLPLAMRVTLTVKGVGVVQWDFSRPQVSG